MINLSYKKVYKYEEEYLTEKQIRERVENSIGRIIDALLPQATPKERLKALEVFIDKETRNKILYYLSINIETEQQDYINILDTE